MAVRDVQTNGALVHVRFAGRSTDVPVVNLDVGAGAGDLEVKRALAGWLDVHPSRLSDYVVDRHVNGNMTLRPEAVFG
jgi:hypothetical protein